MMSHTLHDDDIIEMPPMSESYHVLNTKDGSIACTALTDQHWEAILKLIDRQELKEDERHNLARPHDAFARYYESAEGRCRKIVNGAGDERF